MKKIFNGLKITVIILVAVMSLMFLSVILNKRIGGIITNNVFSFIAVCFLVVGFLELILLMVKGAHITVNKWAYRLWTGARADIKNYVSQYIQDENTDISSPIWNQILSIYGDDDEICSNLLQNIPVEPKQNDTPDESILAYLLLENIHNNNIARYFREEGIQYRNYCEKKTVKISQKEIKRMYQNKEYLKEMNLRDVIVALFHACLPQNPVDRERIIYIARYVVQWPTVNITKDNLKDNLTQMLSLAMLLPVLKRKLEQANINDAALNENIKDAERSRWLKRLIQYSYEQVLECCNNRDLTNEMNYKCANVLCVYFENMKITHKARLQYIVYEKKKKLRKVSAHAENEEILSFLLTVMPLKRSEQENDSLLKTMLLLYYSCINFGDSIMD